MTEHLQGYAEGYYGKLFTWDERLRVLGALQASGYNTYYYAPKEDPAHRWQWRLPYSVHWREQFSCFCSQAKERGISVIAGVAPGLDFNFSDLPNGIDFITLLVKCRQLLHDGADHVSLLMDDIDADFATRCGMFISEGEAHARLANELAVKLGQPLWVTPRIYANELAKSEGGYLPSFFNTLDDEHTVLYCGSDIVPEQAVVQDIYKVAPQSSHRLVLWDNLYANDVLLNPTGMLHTDLLLLDIMSNTQQLGHSPEALDHAWHAALRMHGVPEGFLEIAPYFYHPAFNGKSDDDLPIPSPNVFEAIEECLWHWKTPLSREWYSFIYSLKLDLLISEGRMSSLRVRKTQIVPMARLINRR